MTVQYVIGDATAPAGTGRRIVAHVCNDRGGWGKGFVLAVSRRWPQAERGYRIWSHTSTFRLGAVQWVRAEPDVWVANMVAQSGYRTASNPIPLRYEALEQCLTTVADHAVHLAAGVHMPRIGCGLAGGTWDAIVPILDGQLTARGVTTTVYDLEQPAR